MEDKHFRIITDQLSCLQKAVSILTQNVDRFEKKYSSNLKDKNNSEREKRWSKN